MTVLSLIRRALNGEALTAAEWLAVSRAVDFLRGEGSLR